MVCHKEQSFCIKILSYYPSYMYIISSVITTQNNTEKCKVFNRNYYMNKWEIKRHELWRHRYINNLIAMETCSLTLNDHYHSYFLKHFDCSILSTWKSSSHNRSIYTHLSKYKMIAISSYHKHTQKNLLSILQNCIKRTSTGADSTGYYQSFIINSLMISTLCHSQERWGFEKP